MRLSVLDLVPVRSDQTTADALAATVRLAQTADRLDYTRFWVAEHHNLPGIASAATSVVIGEVAGKTKNIRVGAGGIGVEDRLTWVAGRLYPGPDPGTGFVAVGSGPIDLRWSRRTRSERAPNGLWAAPKG